ncbi:hypothetical protein [Amycolatopsis nigrescens]|uniref:hypothetical protein n=1 Tax=Amycolatopsis nigrescens TaxID=381445 RepID=UPI00036D5A84|nr:hypothetical protein [Amycolatopsis nigrescens]
MNGKALTCAVAGSMILLAAPANATATADTGGGQAPPSVTGTVEIQVHNPDSLFEISASAHGSGQDAKGTFRVAHHYNGEVGWATGRVDCLKVGGPLAIVTGVVDRRGGIDIEPGDRISVTVYDNGKADRVGVAEKAARCLGTVPDTEITGGGFTVRG